jgi:chromosome partitioning protein
MGHAETSAFLNQKGGVGKTTTVANVGAALAILGHRVLLVDLDPQGHLTRFLGIDPADVHATVFNVLRDGVHPRDVILERPLRARLHVDGQENTLAISLLPANLDLADAESVFAGWKDRAFRLRNALERVAADYDHILIDCAPGVGLIAVNALVAARRVFIPVQTEYLALESIEGLMTKIEAVIETLNPELEIGGIIATRYDARKVLSRVVVESLRERFGALLLNTVVRDNIALAESPRFGKDIFSYRPQCFGAEDYFNLAQEIHERIAMDEALPQVGQIGEDLLGNESDTLVG